MSADPDCACPRPVALPDGHAGGGRRARADRARAQAGWLRGASRHLCRARHRAGREPLRPHRHNRAAPRVRRSHRRGAARRGNEVDASAVRRRDRPRRALRPRRRRHEGRGRLRDGGEPRLSRRSRRQAQGLDLVSDHRRRGEHRGQRHRQAPAMGRRARGKVRPLHPGRAEQRGGDRRHHQDRPARLAQRRRSSSPASRATSPIRNSPTIRCAAWSS